MQVTLDKNEVQAAVECYLTREGINTAKYDLDIKIVVSRSSEDTKIEVDMTQVENKPVTLQDGDEVPAEADPVLGSPFGDKTDEVAGD